MQKDFSGCTLPPCTPVCNMQPTLVCSQNTDCKVVIINKYKRLGFNVGNQCSFLDCCVFLYDWSVNCDLGMFVFKCQGVRKNKTKKASGVHPPHLASLTLKNDLVYSQCLIPFLLQSVWQALCKCKLSPCFTEHNLEIMWQFCMGHWFVFHVYVNFLLI